METLINRIFELAGPMPDPAAHRRYLAGLPEDELQARAAALEADQNKPRFAAGAMRERATVNLSRGTETKERHNYETANVSTGRRAH